ncbi:sensor histidine kinase [Solimonas marina]|uniref:Signal transduction histidine-protein kinase/phosphatase MprB n=1 Tax=Solimonas marina TaxID=2714601 RepID=A0A969WDM1_9GAMM|nr:HAMP domain-containing sensor histidine kinase [Solimonas marina]NKF22860.1 HAMP domain-containing histidine kinase [Solimonas marina]
MNTLYRRLLLWFCCVNVATLLVSVALSSVITWYTESRAPDWLRLARDADAHYLAGGVDALGDWAADRERDIHVEATLLENGRSLLGGPLLPEVERVLPRLLLQPHSEWQPRPGQLLVAQRVVGADGAVRWFVALRRPAPFPVRRILLLTIQVTLSLLAIGLVGWWFARSISAPAAALQGAAQRMAEGELSARAGGRFDDAPQELQTLAREFDRMAGRVEALVDQQRRLLRDVSHELRSPLARLQLILEFAKRQRPAPLGSFERAEREIARLDHLIDELLTLSQVEAGVPQPRRESVDLAALAAMSVAQAELDARRVGSVLRLDAAVPALVEADAQLLSRALDNLISNAVKFGAGHAIDVRVAASADRCSLSVGDHGPGVAEAELASLFQPFFRGRNARRTPGYGLGLAIVDRVVRAHHGEIQAVNDGGLRVTMSLPVTSAHKKSGHLSVAASDCGLRLQNP